MTACTALNISYLQEIGMKIFSGHTMPRTAAEAFVFAPRTSRISWIATAVLMKVRTNRTKIGFVACPFSAFDPLPFLLIKEELLVIAPVFWNASLEIQREEPCSKSTFT